MNIRVFLYISLISSFLLPANAQEVVTGLTSDIRILEAWKNLDKRKTLNSADTIALPFFDDFSKNIVFPDSKKWEDNRVFINNSYSEHQRTSGIATFDALDNTGRLYESASSAGFEADRLTSKPVDLNYSASDNVCLSFLYEPGGLADEPEYKDSLTLQFFAPPENKWYSVWKAAGSPVHPFRAVIIPISNTIFLKKGFRFRFINYASLSTGAGDPSMATNCDQWNIDYVLLDRNRNEADTLARDVAFTLPVRSLLKTHEAMPWKQFRQVFLSEMGSWIPVHYYNNDTIRRNVTRNFEIWDVYKGSLVFPFSAGAVNIDPSTGVDYKASLIYTFNTDNPDSALFRITSYLITDDFDPKENDTITYYQRFADYFAFDDGSAESGYGINGQGSRNAMVAYRFRSFISDSLRAVRISFNNSYGNTNLRTFDLMIWGNNNGVPGDPIYTQEEMLVTQGEGINGFYTYILNDPQSVSGDFFIGWKQRSETFLNAGFDLNTQHGGKQFYWLNGGWNQSQAKGSIMIRPVFGAPLIATSIDDSFLQKNIIKIFPNPAKDYITIEAGDFLFSSSPVVKIIDLQGRELIKTSLREQTDVSSLSEGIYLIILNINGKHAGYNRFIKTR